MEGSAMPDLVGHLQQARESRRGVSARGSSEGRRDGTEEGSWLAVGSPRSARQSRRGSRRISVRNEIRIKQKSAAREALAQEI